MHCPSYGESEAETASCKAMNPVFLVAVCAAIVLGAWQLNLASQAIFVVGSGEPLTSWIAILVGPVSTLPGAVLALLSIRAGGYWLIGGAVLSIVAFQLGERSMVENLFPFLVRITVPMILAGACVLYLPKVRP
jgi:hypothetical protein